ncbi:MAG: RNA-directed DNA polymerase [Beijerinckiaceae bacterium]|nr:RNA-directed DNA polymerase [Beijerinckiaceae bacterium]
MLQTLSDALWVELRTKGPSTNAFYAPDDQSFSKFHGGHSSEYGPINAWLEFQKTILNFTKKRRYVVVTDIANYYDFISYDHLRNILADLSIAREHALDLLIYTLAHMLWQPDYMPRVQVGLPQINLDGARMLAHCFLFEIDRLFVGKAHIDYARYMDDMDIGVDSLGEAKTALRDLDLALQTRQVRLNSGKTKILDEVGSLRHFRIFENARLDRMHGNMEDIRRAGGSNAVNRSLIKRVVARGLLDGRFASGNGEKILKRCINLAREYGADIDDASFTEIIFEWPSVRLPLLLWWQHSADPLQKLPLLRDFVISSHIVDHLAFINIAVALVSARLPATLKTELLVLELCESLSHKSKWSLFAHLWIISKYGTPEVLMTLIENSASIWMSDEHLSRVVAGFFPRFIAHPFRPKFENTVRRSSSAARSVLEFHIALSTTTEGFTAVKPFISAPNPSQPNRITHSKFLMLASLLNNSTIAPKPILTLRDVHSYALSDGFYACIV